MSRSQELVTYREHTPVKPAEERASSSRIHKKMSKPQGFRPTTLAIYRLLPFIAYMDNVRHDASKVVWLTLMLCLVFVGVSGAIEPSNFSTPPADCPQKISEEGRGGDKVSLYLLNGSAVHGVFIGASEKWVQMTLEYRHRLIGDTTVQISDIRKVELERRSVAKRALFTCIGAAVGAIIGLTIGKEAAPNEAYPARHKWIGGAVGALAFGIGANQLGKNLRFTISFECR